MPTASEIVASLNAAFPPPAGLSESQLALFNADRLAFANAVATTSGAVDTSVSKSADQTDTSGSFVNVTDMSFPVLANTTYHFHMWLVVTGSSFGPDQAQFTGPASPTRFTASWTDPITPAGRTLIAFSSSAALVSATATRYVILVSGLLVNGPNAGTVQLQVASGSPGWSITIHQGSLLRYGSP